MESQLRPGEAFGAYDILEVAGVGGMGVVYRARQRSLDRTVALKLIRPEVAETPDFRERFLREARLAAAVDHPHIVSVYDAGERDRQLFIAMQWVNGQDLASIIARSGALSVSRAVAICCQLAGALDAIHGAGLIHRDVKPANVLVRSMGGRDHAYLTDFGVARAREAVAGLTQAGYLVGTAGFMAPEQIRGQEADSSCDLYALGCVAFECLTGKPPFASENEIALHWAHVSEPRPIAGAVNPALGDRFDAFLARAMAIDPAQRFDDGQDFAQGLVQAAQGEFAPIALSPELSSTPTAESTEPAPGRASSPPGSGGPTRPAPSPVAATVAAAPVVTPGETSTPAPPPGPSEARPAPGGAPGRSRRRALAGAPLWAVAGLVALAILAGVLAATGVFSSGTGAAHSPGGNGGSAANGGIGSGGSSGQANAVLAILRRYEAAFTNRDPSALGALMTPNVVRLGLRPPAPGCQVQAGLQSVVRAEQANFGGVYRFVGLSGSEVHLSGSTAAVSTSYSISTGGSGAIRFELVNGAGGWLITRINANC